MSKFPIGTYVTVKDPNISLFLNNEYVYKIIRYGQYYPRLCYFSNKAIAHINEIRKATDLEILIAKLRSKLIE